MQLAILVPVLLGAMAVAQVTLNRTVASQWGLAPTALLNMTVALVLAVGLTAFCVLRGVSEGLFRVHADPSLVRWWWFLPGCIGFALVVGMPWAVHKLGALASFVALIGAQMLASMLWDLWVEGTAPSMPRVLGALLAVVSVVLTSWK